MFFHLIPFNTCSSCSVWCPGPPQLVGRRSKCLSHFPYSRSHPLPGSASAPQLVHSGLWVRRTGLAVSLRMVPLSKLPVKLALWLIVPNSAPCPVLLPSLPFPTRVVPRHILQGTSCTQNLCLSLFPKTSPGGTYHSRTLQMWKQRLWELK